MNIAIVHYHLRPGGVTRVITNTLNALADSDVICCVLSGEVPDSFSHGAQAVQIDALGYSDRPLEDPAGTISRMRREAETLLGGPPDLWHIHNHSLGKNPTYHLVVAELARQGECLLLQIHDFAEDGRPSNYRLLRETGSDLDDSLYPVGPRVHYGLLNGRDVDLLKTAGADSRFLHFLPNCVQLDLPEDAAPCQDGLIVYPSRGIRRKNVGEILLWATQAVGPECLAITLAPENLEARKIYDAWMQLARDMKLPVAFNVGEGRNFMDVLQSAQYLMTTSVAEGFGLAYLESWLVPRYIVGRDLPEITRDFSAEGLILPGLYEALPVPLDWVHLEALRWTVRDALEGMYGSYGLELPPDRLDEVMDQMTHGGAVDFGRLDERQQRQVIARVIHDGPPQCLEHPPWRLTHDERILKHNRECVQKEYSLETYRVRLETIYTAIIAGATEEMMFISSSRLLDGFLSADRFNLLRT